MADPAPSAATAAPPPQAPGLGELFEKSLLGIVSPGVYRALAARPAPSFGAAAGLAAACGAASMAVNLAHTAVESPGFFARFSPPIMAAVGMAALGLYASVTLLLAVMLYGMGRAMGGTGDFDRGLQAAAMMSVLWPAQMMCNWFPLAWVLPSALAAWVAACALEGLFGARPWPARTVCAVLGAGALGLQTIARAVGEKAQDALAATQVAAQAAGAQADLARQIQAVQAQALATAASAPAQPAPGTIPGAPAATSGLDLLRGGPSDDGPAPAESAPTAPQAAVAQARVMQAGAAGMLDSIMPMISNPALTKNMTAAQKADLKELQDLMADLKAQLNSGHSVSDAAFAQKMQRMQALSLKMMTAAAAAQTAAPPPAAKPVPHLKLPDQDSK